MMTLAKKKSYHLQLEGICLDILDMKQGLKLPENYKGGKKKKLRAENRALQAELTRLKSLQDNHDAEMQRMRKELEQNIKEKHGESDVSIHQNDKIAELNHENWSLKEENSSLMDLLQRSQQDTDFKETEIERLKSDLDGT